MLMTKDVISKKPLQTGRHHIQENTLMYIFPERMFLSDNILFMSFLKLKRNLNRCRVIRDIDKNDCKFKFQQGKPLALKLCN